MTSHSPDSGLASAAEVAVVVLARMGDRSAFDELVRRRQSNLRNLLRRLCRDTTLADDLAQESLLQAWRQLGKLQSTGAFGGWLRQIAVNTWLQHVRRNDSLANMDDVVEQPANTASNMVRFDLDTALSQLPVAVRACVVLAYHEGMSHGEIAAATRMPLGTVKSHITRGAARLRELLAAYNSDYEEHGHACRS